MRETLNSLSTLLESSAGGMLRQDLLLQAYDSYGGDVENEYLIFLTSLAHVVIPLPKIDLPSQPSKQIDTAAKVIENLIPPNADPLNTLVNFSTPPLPFPHYLPEKIEYFFTIFNDPPLETILDTFRLRLILHTLASNLVSPKQIRRTFRYLNKKYTDTDDPSSPLPNLERKRKIGIAAEAFAYGALKLAFPDRDIHPTSPLADKLGIDLYMDGIPISVKTAPPSLPPLVELKDISLRLPNPNKNQPFLLKLSPMQGIYIEISPLNISHLTQTQDKLRNLFSSS